MRLSYQELGARYGVGVPVAAIAVAAASTAPAVTGGLPARLHRDLARGPYGTATCTTWTAGSCRPSPRR